MAEMTTPHRPSSCVSTGHSPSSQLVQTNSAKANSHTRVVSDARSNLAPSTATPDRMGPISVPRVALQDQVISNTARVPTNRPGGLQLNSPQALALAGRSTGQRPSCPVAVMAPCML